MTTRFSWIADPFSTPSSKPWDSILAKSKNFVALPSLGSLVPGWILVVPRRPMLSLAEMSSNERVELRNLIDRLCGNLTSLGGRIFEFEHGAAEAGSLAGCGVDQAHLHVVPLSFDLIDCLDLLGAGLEFKSLSSAVEDFPPAALTGSEYLWCSDGMARSRTGLPTKSESQWFRKLIAKQIGLDESWNYSTHPFEGNIRRTLDLFESK